ncbi:hypothetical protein EJ08DRAFT_520618 [Tothia fuscella]|uniref:Rhodopsin domain-containing protein n=1 Tax=Tothia fuscella TaxID=1048955 RepID=A0A9P4NGU5_9PEZI|nr:hypothetical protein EJ08DRAFT_520618 [Tothia fuscella]
MASGNASSVGLPIALPPGYPPDTSRVPISDAITSPIFAITIGLYCVRMITRVTPTIRLGWDDVTITVAVVLCVAQFIIGVASHAHGVGRHTFYVPFKHIQKVLLLSFCGQMLWIWSITLVKVSVALSLLRITPSKRWANVLKWLVGFLIFSAIVFIALQLAQCSPVSNFWNPTPAGHCWKKSELAVSGYVSGGVFIASDIFLSLFPSTFIRQLKRPRRDKIALAVLMGMGLLASAASAMRLTVTTLYMSESDPLYDIIIPGMWGSVEEYLCIIVACIPFLRVPFENLLRKFGLLHNTQHSRSDRSPYAPQPSPSYQLTPVNHANSSVRAKHREIIIPRSNESTAAKKTESMEILFSKN